jgi:hypothetical protein
MKKLKKTRSSNQFNDVPLSRKDSLSVSNVMHTELVDESKLASPEKKGKISRHLSKVS